MTYLHYYRKQEESVCKDEEYIVLSDSVSPVEYQRRNFDHYKTVEIFEDLYELPLNRELYPR